MPFLIVSLESGVTRIELMGDLDVVTIQVLRRELLGVIRAHPARVEVTVSGVRSANARGTEILLSFFASLAPVGCRIAIIGLRDHPLQSFKAALVDAILEASLLRTVMVEVATATPSGAQPAQL